MPKCDKFAATNAFSWVDGVQRAGRANREIEVSRRTVILIALAGLALLTWVTLVLRAESIEADLVQRAARLFEQVIFTQD